MMLFLVLTGPKHSHHRISLNRLRIKVLAEQGQDLTGEVRDVLVVLEQGGRGMVCWEPGHRLDLVCVLDSTDGLDLGHVEDY